jgi:hypothetical protein
LIHINGRQPPANDCIAISWAGFSVELICIKTPWLLVADKLSKKDSGHTCGYPGVFCQADKPWRRCGDLNLLAAIANDPIGVACRRATAASLKRRRPPVATGPEKAMPGRSANCERLLPPT